MVKSFLHHNLLVAVLAFAVAATWTYATRQMYDYNLAFATVFGVSVFPVIAWTIALTLGYTLITAFFKHVGIRPIPLQFLIMCVVYVATVVIVETIGYHVVGIQNLGTSQYVGLPLCDCLHAPRWMQFGYFALGPLHWILVKIAITSSNLWYFSARSDRIV